MSVSFFLLIFHILSLEPNRSETAEERAENTRIRAMLYGMVWDGYAAGREEDPSTLLCQTGSRFTEAHNNPTETPEEKKNISC